MTEAEIRRIAEAVAAQIHSSCPAGWNAADVATLREFAAALRSAKKTVATGALSLIVLAFGAIVAAGMVAWVRDVVAGR